MAEVITSLDPKYLKLLEELQGTLENPLHKRLIQAYDGKDPLKSMESELQTILLEVLQHED